MAFTSRFLNSVEERYSINEFELLGVVWSIEYFIYYLYGKPFTFIKDHRALLSIMREKIAKISYNSCLTCWFDRLIPFDFSIDHLSCSNLSLVDYISRETQQKAVYISTYEDKFIVAELDSFERNARRYLLNAENYIDL